MPCKYHGYHAIRAFWNERSIVQCPASSMYVSSGWALSTETQGRGDLQDESCFARATTKLDSLICRDDNAIPRLRCVQSKRHHLCRKLITVCCFTRIGAANDHS